MKIGGNNPLNLSTGNYNYTIIDNNGCTFSDSVFINDFHKILLFHLLKTMLVLVASLMEVSILLQLEELLHILLIGILDNQLKISVVYRQGTIL